MKCHETPSGPLHPPWIQNIEGLSEMHPGKKLLFSQTIFVCLRLIHVGHICRYVIPSGKSSLFNDERVLLCPETQSYSFERNSLLTGVYSKMLAAVYHLDAI